MDKLRFGFTTGSCAAATAKAACYMLFTQSKKETITIETPKGIDYVADILDIDIKPDSVSCAVIKDGGDDPDVTSGTKVFSRVEFVGDADFLSIEIDGGIGVGRVTRKGLDQPVGEAAINHVPREMIEKEVKEVCNLFDYKGKVGVTVYIPDGVELAKKTFNPRLGIEGGISVLGTSGVVEPMSEKALLDTIKIELHQSRILGADKIIMTPGNYGRDFLLETYHYDIDKSIKCSNFIGDAIDMAIDEGFEKILLTGHIGKMIKVSGGIYNTHSKEADCRMELLAAHILYTIDNATLAKKVLNCLTTEEALSFVKEEGVLDIVMQRMIDQILFYLNKRANGKATIDVMVYANGFGLLGKSKGADEWFTL